MSNLNKQEIMNLVAQANGQTSRTRAATISDAIGVAFKAMNDDLDPREEVKTYLSVATGKTWDADYRYKSSLPKNHPLSEFAVLDQSATLEWIAADPALEDQGLVAAATSNTFDSIYAKAKLQVMSNLGKIDPATYEGLRYIELEDI